MRFRFVVLKCETSSAVGVPDFLEDNWQKMVVYNSELTILRCFSDTIATCSVFPKKKTGDHLLGGAWCASNFC